MPAQSISSFEAEDPTALALQALTRDGVVIIKNVLSNETVDHLNTILEPLFEAPQTGGSEFISSKTTSIGGIFGIDAAFSEHLMLNRHMLELSDAILLPKKPMAASSPAPAREPALRYPRERWSCGWVERCTASAPIEAKHLDTASFSRFRRIGLPRRKTNSSPCRRAQAILRALRAVFPVRFAYVTAWGREERLRFWHDPPEADVAGCDTPQDLDPMVIAGRAGRSGTFSLRDVAPPGFEDSELYQRLYVGNGIIDELQHMPAPSRGQRLFVSAGVTKREPFTAEELSHHAAVSPTILASLVRLWRLVDSELSDELFEETGDVDSALDRFGREILSRREQEVVHLILRGHNGESVAQKLDISPNTVRRHRASVYDKLHVSSQGELFHAFLQTLGLRVDE